jgi:hypothetical protein
MTCGTLGHYATSSGPMRSLTFRNFPNFSSHNNPWGLFFPWQKLVTKTDFLDHMGSSTSYTLSPSTSCCGDRLTFYSNMTIGLVFLLPKLRFQRRATFCQYYIAILIIWDVTTQQYIGVMSEARSISMVFEKEFAGNT